MKKSLRRSSSPECCSGCLSNLTRVVVMGVTVPGAGLQVETQGRGAGVGMFNLKILILSQNYTLH